MNLQNLYDILNSKMDGKLSSVINNKRQKLQIAEGIPYESTSLRDVMEQKFKNDEEKKNAKQSEFVQLPTELKAELDPDFADNTFIKSAHQPFQQKVELVVTSDDEPENEEERENLRFIDQPYNTVHQIGWSKLLNHLPTKQITRRSDIMVTSTLSFSLFPKRILVPGTNFALMTQEDIDQYLKKRSEIRAKCEHSITQSKERNKSAMD